MVEKKETNGTTPIVEKTAKPTRAKKVAKVTKPKAHKFERGDKVILHAGAHWAEDAEGIVSRVVGASLKVRIFDHTFMTKESNPGGLPIEETILKADVRLPEIAKTENIAEETKTSK
jgi:hypothetical protein